MVVRSWAWEVSAERPPAPSGPAAAVTMPTSTPAPAPSEPSPARLARVPPAAVAAPFVVVDQLAPSMVSRYSTSRATARSWSLRPCELNSESSGLLLGSNDTESTQPAPLPAWRGPTAIRGSCEARPSALSAVRSARRVWGFADPMCSASCRATSGGRSGVAGSAVRWCRPGVEESRCAPSTNDGGRVGGSGTVVPVLRSPTGTVIPAETRGAPGRSPTVVVGPIGSPAASTLVRLKRSGTSTVRMPRNPVPPSGRSGSVTEIATCSDSERTAVRCVDAPVGRVTPPRPNRPGTAGTKRNQRVTGDRDDDVAAEEPRWDSRDAPAGSGEPSSTGVAADQSGSTVTRTFSRPTRTMRPSSRAPTSSRTACRREARSLSAGGRGNSAAATVTTWSTPVVGPLWVAGARVLPGAGA